MIRETKRRAEVQPRPLDGAGVEPPGITSCSVRSRRRAFQSASVFAVLLLLVCAPILRAQATLGTTTGDTNAFTINSNNSPGLVYNAVLNTDSSVSLLQDGTILSGQGCPAFSGLSSGISSEAVYVDFANSNIYLTMISGGAVYAAYESINQEGTCTQGPLLELTTNALSNLEMNVDPVQGSVYILNSFGAFPDTLYILPTAPWSASPLPTPATLSLDYSAQYGPIVIDPSNHMVYVNDLGDSAYGTVGTYSTSGFFVYDPNQSTTPADNLQHVVGYNNGATTTVLNVETLLDNGAGKLVLINENPSAASSTVLGVPIAVLDTTQFSFFTGTTKPSANNNNVDITPGAGLSTISAASQYTAIGGADINTASNSVDVFAFNSNSLTTPGMLLEYNLAPGAASPETVLSSSTAMPSLYGSLAPWNRLNFNPESTELVLSVGSQFGSGALGLTSPLCAGAPLSLTQLFGTSVSPTPLGYPVVNSASGYIYAIQPGPGTPPGPSIVNFVAPPSDGCSTSPPIQISPATLIYDYVGESYFEDFTATGGSGAGYVWSVTSGTALSAVGLSLTSAGIISGYPNATETAAPFTVKVVDSQGNTATQSYTLTIYPYLTITPTTLPAGTMGTSYSQTFMAAGASGGPFTFSVASGTALSAVGLTLSTAGTISGTPNATETAAAFVLRVVDSLDDFSQLNYTLTINSAVGQPAQVTDNETITVSDNETFPDVVDSEPITVTDMVSVTTSPIITTTGPLPTGIVGVQYAGATLAATGGTPPYTWTATGMPPGVTIGPSTGVISGIPTTAGAYTVTVTVTDTASLTSSTNFSITVTASGPVVDLSPASLTFTAQASSTQSAAQTVTLTNIGNAPLNITGTGISISGSADFSQTNTCGTSVAAGSNCVISVTFNPSLLSSGTYFAELNMADNASGSPQEVSLTGIVTGTASGPIANLSTTLLTFAPQASGTASATQTVTLTNTGNAPLSIAGSGITISGANATDFAQTNQCPSSVAAGSNCPINVTFTPISPPSGIVAAELNVADNAGGSPQQVGLSGIVLPSTSVSCTIPPLTLSADSATDQITCAEDLTNPAPLGPIALVCNLPTSLSKYITCSFSPNSLSFTSSSTPAYAASTTLTIQRIQSGSASLERKSRPWAASSGGVAFAAVLWLPAWLFVSRRKKTRSKRGILFLLILLCGLPMITSCVGKSGSSTPPAGTYQASVVLTGPGLNETITFTIQEP